MKSYQYIFFDWDGCLANSLNIWINAIKFSLDKYKLPYSNSDVIMMLGDLYNPLLRLGLKHEDFNDFKKILYSHVDSNSVNVSLYEGAEQLLKDLKSDGKRLALISSGSRSSLEQMLKSTRTKEYFEVVISGSDVQRRKPHPEGIQKALEHLGSEKASTIMVGDSQHDLMAAHNAGIDSVLFYPDAHTMFYDFEDLKKSNPTYIIRRFDELKKVLDPT